MSNTKDIAIDPITQKEFDETADEAFNTFVDALGDIDFSEMDYQEIAEVFFYNGFYRGCMAMTENEDIKETLYMMRKEIDYQTKKQ